MLEITQLSKSKYFKMFELEPTEVLDLQLLNYENFLLKKMLIDYGVKPNLITQKLKNKNQKDLPN